MCRGLDTRAPADSNSSGQDEQYGAGEYIGGVQSDHPGMYLFAAAWIRRRLKKSHRRIGLDVFIGAGSGSRIIADRTVARLICVNGSAGAVRLAHEHYADHRVVFAQAACPFTIATDTFDFAACYGSVERLREPLSFLQILSRGTHGPLFLSSHNEDALPLGKHGAFFRYHHQHYSAEGLTALMQQADRSIVSAQMGQDLYRVDADGSLSLFPELRTDLYPLRRDSQVMVMVFERA